MKISHLRMLRLLGAAVICVQSGCAGTSLRKAHSSLPIEVAPGFPALSAVRAFETDAKLYVSGSGRSSLIRRVPAAAHVDVSLVGHDGRVIAGDSVRFTVRCSYYAGGRGGNGGAAAFVASFNVGDARRAAMIRVVPHLERHASAAGNGGTR